ncbi:hybrid signal transduction histidine kinase M [Tanacetum coccineum]|uniref:Hybrid signal transduction histidine kinase M n=1 Tax=Tanacetum coccineum TaxID=301880 RepID=A0ABQ5CZV7_9ASTR
MTVTNSSQVILFSDKLKTITNLTTLVHVKLDVDEMNNSSYNCCSLKLGDLTIDAYFRKIESIDTILTSLGSPINNDDMVTIALEGLPDNNPQTAKPAWDLIAKIFNDNKRTCSIALKAELRSLKLGDLTIDAYFRKIESIATILTSLGSPINNDDVVTIALKGLPDKYDNVSSIIVYREPF